MDIFGLPYSDDDEEEYRPPMEENDTEKENDNYILELVPEIIPLPENIYNTVNMEKSTIAERTRARGANTVEINSEIPFDSLQNKQNAMDPELEEKEEYCKFIQGVFLNDPNTNQNTMDADDGDDEDYVPPVDVPLERSYKKRISEKDVNSVVLDKNVRRPERPIKPRLFSSSVLPNIEPQPISLNSMQFLLLQSQFMCFAQLIIQQYLLCSKSENTKPLLKRIRNMILSLKTASNISSSVPHEESPSPLKGLQNLRKLTIFNSTNPTNHSIPQSITTILQYDSILQLFDIIDEMYKQAPKPADNTTPLKRKRAKPIDLSNDPVYTSVMDSYNLVFDTKLKPSVIPSNKEGGYGSTGRLQFTPSEDALLAIGVTLLGDDYDLISKELLVTKTIQQLRNRSKNQRNNRGNNNIIRQYYSLYIDFIKWDPAIYTQICDIITTRVTSWQVMQRMNFYFYSDMTLKYYWLYSYFQLVKKQRLLQNEPKTPFFLTTPRIEASSRAYVATPIAMKTHPLQQIRVNPDPSTQIYEKDVILEDDIDYSENLQKKKDMPDKRPKLDDDIDREELTDEEV